jgi:DNA-binding MarR family transcriptional regulator
VKQPADATTTFSDPLQTMLGYQLRRTSVALISALAEDLAPLGVKPSEATLIMLVAANPGCTQSEISRALRAKPANLVPLINALAAVGAIERTAGRGPAIKLSLSAKGEALHAKLRVAFERNEAVIARHIPDDRRDEMIAILRRICTDACCGPDALGDA